MEQISYYIKTRRDFTRIRRYAWILTLFIAIGGLWEPRLGLVVIAIMAGLTITAFFKGRYWCGNFCPHGSLYDVVLQPLSMNQRIPSFLKSKPMIVGFFVFFMFNFGRRMLEAFQTWGTTSFLERLGSVFVFTYLVVMIAGGLMAVFINPRVWCQFCPMGTIQKIAYSLGRKAGVNESTDQLITMTQPSMCHRCGKCARVCPFQLEPYVNMNDHNQFDDFNCIRCATCVENCPAGILSLKTKEEADSLKAQPIPEGYQHRRLIYARIQRIHQLTKDLREYVLTFVDPPTVPYRAGQFMLIRVTDEPKAYRAYSIASYDEQYRQVSLIIKQIPEGYGTAIIFNQYQEGDLVELEGPMGEVLVPDRGTEKMVFVANGIGITPFLALVQEVLTKREEVQSVLLINGQRYKEDLLYHETLRTLEKEYPHFQYLPVLSRDSMEGIPKGHATTLLKDRVFTGYKAYLCGTGHMIQDAYQIMTTNGLDEKAFFFETEEKIPDLQLPASMV